MADAAVPVPPYSRLSAVYDHVMRHVDYKRWARHVVDLLKLGGMKEGTILEAACGTGTLSLLLPRRRFTILAFDSSEEMLAIARRKAQRRPDIMFFRADLTSFRPPAPVDAVICLYDSVNYLIDPGDVRRFLECVRAALLPGGLLIMDAATEHNSVSNTALLRDSGTVRSASYIRDNYYVPEEKIHYTEFTIRTTEGTFLERHRERLYSEKEIDGFLRRARFGEVRGLDDFNFGPATAESDRMHFLAKAV